MRQHARRGARILTGIVGLEGAAEAVLHHHEHFDGTGYHDGLSGEQIPLLSRIILVADAYDAMTSPRPFRDACARVEAVAHATDPFKLAALDTIGADRLYMLRLSRTDLFRIHAATQDTLERRLNPIL